MTITELLDDIRRRGAQLQVEDGKLLVDAPVGTLDDGILRALRERKPEILAWLQDRSDRYAPFALTDIQHAYWVGRSESLELGGVGCHYYQEFESEGLDLPRLEHAFQCVIERHEMMRAIVQADGRQRVLESPGGFEFGETDTTHLDPESARSAIAAVRARMSERVYTPEQWPLYDIHATRQSGDRVIIHLSFDLLLLDARCLSQVIHEWGQLYHGTGPLSPLTASFRGLLAARSGRQGSRRRRKAEAYWRARAGDFPLAPQLPAPRPSSLQETSMPQRRRHRAEVSPARWAAIKSRARRLGATPSAFLSAAFSRILGAWSTPSRLCLNLTVSNPPMDAHAVVGDFTETVLLDVDAHGIPFSEVVRNVATQLGECLDNSDLSGVEVLRLLGRRGNKAHLPVVFTSLVGHTESWASCLFSPNWLGEPGFGTSQTPQVSFDHQAFEHESALVFQWDVLDSTFPLGMIEAMFAAYVDLLTRLADSPEAWRETAEQLPRLQARSRARANDTAKHIQRRRLQDGFLERAALAPNADAIVTSSTSITYGELERTSLSIARQLNQQGIETGEHVGIVMHKGWEQIAAVLGVLRAGAAYLPVSAELPPARVQQVLLRGRVRVVLRQRDASIDLGSIPSIEVTEDQADAHALPAIAGTGDAGLAYTIFTSGSTGVPKGVMVSHRAASNTISDINERFAVSSRDRVLAISALDFDLSVYDLFATLAVGGAIVLPDADKLRDPEHWADLIKRHRVTVWNSVPALASMLVEATADAHPEALAGLRLVMLSGDWIPVGLPDALRSLSPAAQIVSLGGATEAGIWSIAWNADSVDPKWPSLPYGTPLANQAFRICREDLTPCPDWTTGELLISGDGLADGYFGDPEETARRFVEDPTTGERLYRTGDLGRYLSDGNIELLGRADFQVKIDGYRIELGEIESVLREHPDAKQAVADVVCDASGSSRLVVYIVGTGQSTATPALWRAFLAQRLPRYMVPTQFVELEEVPLTANGKIDRSALPRAQVGPTRVEQCAPRTPTESIVLEAVSRVMERSIDSMAWRFDDLGCTSLQLVQVFRHLLAAGYELRVAEVFSHPDLASLASALDGIDSSGAHGAMTPVQRASMARRRQRSRRVGSR